MLMANSMQAAVQKEAFPLAGMISFVKVFGASTPDGMYANVNVFSLSKLAEIFTNLGVFSLSKTNDNATNIDVWNLSKPDPNATYLDVLRPVRAREASVPTVITSLNEARLTVIRVSNECRLSAIARVTGTKKGSTSNATLLHTADRYQLFGSMPRLSSSRRNKRFIQPERLSSPSSCIATDRRSYNSASKRNWTANRSFLLSLVDILNHQHVSSYQVDNVYQRQQKQNPVSADTPTGFLTTTVIISNEEAVLNHITPQQVRHSHTLNTGTELPSFIWIIAAVRRDCQVIAVQIHHIEAESEREARRSLAREHVTFFAGRIRKGAAHAE